MRTDADHMLNDLWVQILKGFFLINLLRVRNMAPQGDSSLLIKPKLNEV